MPLSRLRKHLDCVVINDYFASYDRLRAGLEWIDKFASILLRLSVFNGASLFKL
jgi:hypothetical protein